MDDPTASSSGSRARPTRDEFDEDGYLHLHPDVDAAVAAGVVGSGWQHFNLHGAAERVAMLRMPMNAAAERMTGDFMAAS